MRVKNNTIDIFIFVLNCTFGILQSFVGLFLFLFYITKKHYWYRGGIVTIAPNFPGGISLGIFIVVGSNIPREQAQHSDLINHEVAHQRQSALLGMFFLFIIGIPSICWAGFGQKLANNRRKKKGLPLHSYYDFFTEKNAEWIRKKYLQKDERSISRGISDHMNF